MNEIEIKEAYRKIKRRVCIRLIVGFFSAAIAGFIWLLIYSYFFDYAGYYFFLGFAVVAFTVYFWVRRIDKDVICPSCNRSLMDIDGDSGYYVTLKRCPYCDADFK